MTTTTIHTAEFVSPGHPDKLCDYIADSILDAYKKRDPSARTAIEVMGGHGIVKVNGEVTSEASVDVEAIVRSIVGDDIEVITRVTEQSPEIARGVDDGGAGDQGVMIGYACTDTDTCMPYEYELARGLCRHLYQSFPYDGKTQATVYWENGEWKVKTLVASFQHATQDVLIEYMKDFAPDALEYIANPAGDWTMGGFDADAGLTGRKIVVDAYGPRVPVGGGAFSGKDHTKVDRSGAYMARAIARELLKEREVNEVLVKLAYAIGRKEPVKAVVSIDGKEEVLDLSCYDLSPAGIREKLNLDDLSYAELSRWGHFGNEVVQ